LYSRFEWFIIGSGFFRWGLLQKFMIPLESRIAENSYKFLDRKLKNGLKIDNGFELCRFE